MAPPKGRRSPDQPASAGMAGEWKTATGERTVRQSRQPQKSSTADVSAAPAPPRQVQSKGAGSTGSSGFTRPGA
eukprot:15444826-Alexandrium_andersonii.AAC.1